MMTSAGILLAAVLGLGGILAAIGDRLGSKVGKARWRVLGLRPRQSATLVAILTGLAIAASTLGTLFALSESLREGVFQLDGILADLRIAQAEATQFKQELTVTRQEKAQIEQNWQQSQQSLDRLNQQLAALQTEREALLKQLQQQCPAID